MRTKKFNVILVLISIVLIVISISIEIGYADLNEGLVAYYPFNGNANDESGNGNHGSVYGATLTVDRCGMPDRAYRFNGSDYIDLGNGTVNVAGDLTLSLWVKVDGSQGSLYPQQAFIGKMGSSGAGQDNQYLIEIWDSAFSAWAFEYQGKGNMNVYNFAWPADVWVHVAFTYDSTTTIAKLYFQGSLLKEETFLNFPYTCNINASLGATPSDVVPRYLQGCLDDVRIYNRTLSDFEIQELFNKTCSIIDIDPDILNIKSKGKWITCYIELPTGYAVDDIDVSTVILTINNNSIPTGEGSPAEIGDYDNDGISDLMVKFDRGAVQKIVTEGSVEMTVTASLIGGTQFKGFDTVLVIDKGQEHIDELDHGSVAY